MSFLPDSLLLDSSTSHLFHLPEALEGIASFQPVCGGGHEDRSVSAVGNRAGEERGSGGVPVDILKTPKSYTFFLDVPSLQKSEILVIRSNAKRKRDEGEEKGCKYLRLERKLVAPLRFTREFRLPEDSNSSGIRAKCEDRVFTVVVEKLPLPPEVKKVAVVIG